MCCFRFMGAKRVTLFLIYFCKRPAVLPVFQGEALSSNISALDAQQMFALVGVYKVCRIKNQTVNG